MYHSGENVVNSKKKINIAHFNMFIKIAESGSLSKAARELGLTPSAVSRGLATLEVDLGTNLVNRTTRVLTLTDPGKAFLEKAYHLLDELDNIVEAVKQFNRPIGTLKITCSLAVGCSQLHQLILSYQKEYPEGLC